MRQGAKSPGARDKFAVLRGHCAAVGRDIAEIEVTALLQPREDWTPDDVLRQAEACAAVGTATVMASALGQDRAAGLESIYAPAMARLAEIRPAAL